MILSLSIRGVEVDHIDNVAEVHESDGILTAIKTDGCVTPIPCIYAVLVFPDGYAKNFRTQQQRGLAPNEQLDALRIEAERIQEDNARRIRKLQESIAVLQGQAPRHEQIGGKGDPGFRGV